MSTNKTQNYNLHSWLPQDEFHLTEINENFAKLDEELALELEALQDTFADEVAEIKTTLGGKADKTALAALGRLVIGTYTGTGGTQTIDLGHPVLAVLVEQSGGLRPDANSSLVLGGMALPGYPLRNNGITVQGTGFSVLHGGTNNWTQLNVVNTTYYYLAIIQEA